MNAVNVDGAAEDILSVEVMLLCFKSLTVQKELIDESSDPFWVSRIQTRIILFMLLYTQFYFIYLFWHLRYCEFVLPNYRNAVAQWVSFTDEMTLQEVSKYVLRFLPPAVIPQTIRKATYPDEGSFAVMRYLRSYETSPYPNALHLFINRIIGNSH